ncbi:putative phospholipase D [Helianthus anomalus]
MFDTVQIDILSQFVEFSPCKRINLISAYQSIQHLFLSYVEVISVKLVCGVANTLEYTLGDLSKLKSQEGVRVLLLVWRDSWLPIMKKPDISLSTLRYKCFLFLVWREKDTAGSRSRGTLAGCPREPWHDMHSEIDGPAAYDLMTNFEERWLKASKPHGLKKTKNFI